MKEYVFLVIALLFVVFLSGCIGQPQVNVTSGGKVSVNMNVTPITAPRNTPVSVTLKVVNKALIPIKNVEASLFGPVEWQLGEPKTSPRIEPNGEREYTWNARTSLPGKYYIHGKVTYTFENNKTATYRVVKYGTPAGETPGLVSQSNDLGGPLRIDFAGTAPTIYPDEGGTLSIKIILTNVGEGRAYKIDGVPEQGKGLDEVWVSIHAPGLKFSAGSDSVCTTPGIVELINRGTSASIYCDAQINPQDVNILKDFVVIVNVKANYYHQVTSPQITITER
ncbi:MAG: hypothetical protein QXQ77_02290 [Candidatus Aenigmatarchaeota archaeon]